MASNLRNRFVGRRLRLYFCYIIFEFPYYSLKLIYYIGAENKMNNKTSYCFIIMHFLLGFFMFLILAKETNFYQILFFCCNKNKNFKNLEMKNENFKKVSELFLDPDQPLTENIDKTLSLEFMCCILFGFSKIFNKIPNYTKEKITLLNEQYNKYLLIDSGDKSKLNCNLLEIDKYYFINLEMTLKISNLI